MFVDVFQNLIKLLILYIVCKFNPLIKRLIKSFGYKLQLFIIFKIIITMRTYQ